MNVLLIVLALAAAPPRRAPTPEENKAFQDGLDAMGRGDPRAAEKAWRTGYDVGRDPAFLVRIAEAQEKAGAPAEAVESYRRYVREAPDAADRAEIEARIARIAPPTPAPPPAPDEEPGRMMGAPGAPPPALPAAPQPAAGPAAQVGDAGEPVRTPTAEPSHGALHTAGWVGVAATVAALGAAGFFGASARSAADDVNQFLYYREEKTGRPQEFADVQKQYEDAYERGRSADRNARIAVGAAGVSALASILFFALEGRF